MPDNTIQLLVTITADAEVTKAADIQADAVDAQKEEDER